MVVKTEMDSFSEFRIYPGHGIRSVKNSGQAAYFGRSKERRLHAQKKKPQKLTWTQAWRRMNKKGPVLETTRKRVRKGIKNHRSIVGLPLDDLRKRMKVTVGQKLSTTESGAKEVAERSKKEAKQRAAAVVRQPSANARTVPKHQKAPTFNARGGSRR